LGDYCYWAGCITVGLSDLLMQYNTNSVYRADHPLDALPFILPDPLPKPPPKAKAPKPSTPIPAPLPSLKRSAPDDDDDILPFERSSKKPKPNGMGTSLPTPSPKKRRLEEDGLVLMDSKDDKLDDDVIEID
jgi:ubiquitin-like 1-activating enzyme E1 B